MSKIIRHMVEAAPVFIGKKHYDAESEVRAERKLGILFPAVSFITTPEGAKLIPIQEVYKLEEMLQKEKEETRRSGYEQGHQVGLDKGLIEARKVLSQFEQAIQDAVSQREAMLEEAREEVLKLVIEVSKKVTFDAVNIDQEATVRMINSVINQLVDRSKLRVKVNPQYLPILEQSIDRFLSSSTTIKELTFEADPRVNMGGCFIETPSGDIDARLESQLDVIAQTLLNDGEDT